MFGQSKGTRPETGTGVAGEFPAWVLDADDDAELDAELGDDCAGDVELEPVALAGLLAVELAGMDDAEELRELSAMKRHER